MPEPSTSPTRRAKINIPTERIAEICSRWGLRRLALFGSVLRDDVRAYSDVDLMSLGHIPRSLLRLGSSFQGTPSSGLHSPNIDYTSTFALY